MKKMVLLLVALAVTSISLVSCGGSSSSSPSDVVKKSFKLLESKDYAKISELYASGKGELLTDEEKTKMEGMMGMAAAEYEKKGGVKEIIIDEENISDDGTTAKVKYTVKNNDGSESTAKANLIKIDGKWYMSLRM